MSIFGKPFDKISIEDIKNLKENKVSESLTLEYKATLELNTDEQKKEFLADVSSFANKLGGTIIYGIKCEKDKNNQNTGIPKAINGIKIENIDKFEQKIEQILITGLQPKLTNISFNHDIDVNGSIVFIIDIPRSLFAPHCVWYKRSGKFFIRNNTGKDQMNVDQIREAFLQSAEWKKNAENLRDSRIKIISSRKLIHNLDITQIPCILHIFPLGYNREFLEFKKFIPKIIDFASKIGISGSFTKRANLDGLLYFIDEKSCDRYVQFFRDGGVEVFLSIRRRPRKKDDSIHDLVDGQYIEGLVINFLSQYLDFASSCNIHPPLVVFITLTRVKGKYLGYFREFFKNNYSSEATTTSHMFDRDMILLPGTVIDNIGAMPEDIMEPILDMFWQAGGWPESPFNKGRKNKGQK